MPAKHPHVWSRGPRSPGIGAEAGFCRQRAEFSSPVGRCAVSPTGKPWVGWARYRLPSRRHIFLCYSGALRLCCPQKVGTHPPHCAITGCDREQQTHKYKTIQCKCPVWGNEGTPKRGIISPGFRLFGQEGLAPGSQVWRGSE